MSLPVGAELYLISSDQPSTAYPVAGEGTVFPEGTIQEGRSYVVELRNVRDPDHVDLVLDDEVLEALRSPDPTTARWRWSPGFHAGVVEVRLKIRGRLVHRMEWTTDPDLRKLTRDDFTSMVREILEDSYSLFSLSSFRFGVARGSSRDDPPISRLEFLRSRVEAIETAVRGIAAKPVRLLKNEHARVPYHRARSLSGPDLNRSLAGRLMPKAPGGSSTLPRSMKEHWPAELRISTRVSGYDIPEHRLVKASLRFWSEWLWSVGEALSTASHNDAPDADRSRWVARCRRLSRQLSALLTLPLFRDVADVNTRISGSSVFRRIPAYRRFHSLYRDMNLGILNIAGDFLNLPLARTFDLYEMWAYLRLARAAVELFRLQGIDAGTLFRPGAVRNSMTLASDAALLQLAPGVSLAFKRNYREYWLERDGTGSFSRTMQPDITIRVGPTGAVEQRLIVIDAKYRVSTQLSAALASIHMYRDALVHGDLDGNMSHSVVGAYLVTPENPDESEDWRTTGMPNRLFHPGYRSMFRFGAVTLRPGLPLESAKDALRIILADAGVRPETGEVPSDG